MLFFLFTDIFCIFKSKTARYELRNLSNHAICPVLPGSDSLCSTLFCEGRVRHVSYPLVGMVCAKQSRLGADGSSFICGNGAWGMEGRSRGVYPAGHIRRIIHAALFSALICFSVTDEREEPDAAGYHGDGNTFQCNQCDLVGCQLFQLCIAGKVRTGHILDKSFTLGRTRDFFHRYGHQSACRPCNPEFTEAGRYASLPAGERFLPLCDFSQLLWGAGGMDRICLADGFTCGLGVCVVDGCQPGAACRCHLQTLL